MNGRFGHVNSVARVVSLLEAREIRLEDMCL